MTTADRVVPGEARAVARLVRGYLAVTAVVVALATALTFLSPGATAMSGLARLVGAAALLSLQVSGARADWERHLLAGRGQRWIDVIVVGLMLVNALQPVVSGPDPMTAWGVAVTAVFAGLVTSNRGMAVVAATFVTTSALAIVRHAATVEPVLPVTAALVTAVLGWLAWYAGRSYRSSLRSHHATTVELARATAEAQRTQAHTIEELRRVDRMKDDFISTVSHELRTPLTVVRGLATTLQRGDVELDTAVRDQILERLAAKSIELEAIISRLLDFDALQRRDDHQRARADVARCVRAGVAAVDTGDHPVELVLEDAVVAVGGPLLIRVVRELVDNAVAHTPPTTPVTVAVVGLGDLVEISVHDDGPGIDPQVFEQLLAAFARGGSYETRETRGLGLGLTVCDRLVRSCHGTLTLAEPTTGGTTITVTLPRAADTPASVPAPTPAEATAATA